jgi:hypothetical protein
MEKKPKILNQIDLLVLLSLALIGFILICNHFLSFQNKNLIPKQTKTNLLSENIPVKFNPETLSASPGEQFTIKIVPVNQLSALVYHLEIVFDPKVLSVKNIENGHFFKNPTILQKEFDNQAGRIYFSAGINPEELKQGGEPKNSYELMTIVFAVNQTIPSSTKSTVVFMGEKTAIFAKENSFKNSDLALKPLSIILKTSTHE